MLDQNRPPLAKPRRRRVKKFLIGLAIIIVLLIIAIVIIWRVYEHNLRPVSAISQAKVITIKPGTSINQIGGLLQTNGLVRSGWAFEWYVREHQDRSKLQAGTYSLSPSRGVKGIVAILTKGKIASKLVTIIPGDRLDQIRSTLINSGFSPSDVDNALKPSQYSNLPALAYKPKSASLAGFLYPDSFAKISTTKPSAIVRESLTEMGKHLTPKLQAAFSQEGLSTYQGIILASIVMQEVSKPGDQAQAAQVFLSRLKANIPLGSVVTARYGAIIAGQTPSVKYDSPYNTLLHKGLPPTPISNVNEAALQAAAHPAATHWLYFVSGDNGKTYFSKTLQQHKSNVANYCHKKCAADNQ
ncbi:MAG: endolytic transglycosylase MltG [Candidatus Saccharimonadales bacterium]